MTLGFLLPLILFLHFINFSFLNSLSDVRIWGVSIEGLKNIPLLYFSTLVVIVHAKNVRFTKSTIRDIYPFLIFFMIAGITIAWSISFYYSLRSFFIWLLPLNIFILSELYMRNRRNETIQDFLRFLHFVIYLNLIISLGNIAYGLLTGTGIFQDIWGAKRLVFNVRLPFWYMHLICFSCIYFFISYRIRRDKWSLVLSVAILSFIILSNIRTYIFSTIIAIMLCEVFRQKAFPKRIAVIALTGVSMMMLLFYFQPLRSKMFLEEGNTMGKLRARDYMNPFIAPAIRLSDRNLINAYIVSESFENRTAILGSGIGTARYILESSERFEKTTSSHSDYAKYLAEFGILGFGFYLFILYRLLMNRYRDVRSVRNEQKAWMVYSLSCFGFIVFIVISGLTYEAFTPVNTSFVIMFLSLARFFKRQYVVGNEWVVDNVRGIR